MDKRMDARDEVIEKDGPGWIKMGQDHGSKRRI